MAQINNTDLIQGGCYCGAVRYEIQGPIRGVVNCHCTRCTRLNGHFGGHSKAPKEKITITQSEGLKWFKISDVARRAFCRECGSGLFWDHIEQDAFGIVAGSLDAPTGLTTIGHIFVSDKADFYEITDDLPQFSGSSDGKLEGDYV